MKNINKHMNPNTKALGILNKIIPIHEKLLKVQKILFLGQLIIGTVQVVIFLRMIL